MRADSYLSESSEDQWKYNGVKLQKGLDLNLER